MDQFTTTSTQTHVSDSKANSKADRDGSQNSSIIDVHEDRRKADTHGWKQSPVEAADPDAQTEIARGIDLGAIASQREILLHGRRAFDRGEDGAALESLNRLVAHGVRFADVHYMVGMIQERRGDIDTALHQLAEAIRINPSYVEALLALASLYERRGEYGKSQGYAERASQLSQSTAAGLDPTTRGKLANQQAALADALVEAGERRDAIEQYRGALDRCPTFHDIRHRLAVTLREAGLPAQAAQEFQRILRLHPGLLESQVQLGLTYYTMGRTPDAIGEWNAVLEKDPSRDEARMYLRLVRGTDSVRSAGSRSAYVGADNNERAPSADNSRTTVPAVHAEEKELDESIEHFDFGATLEAHTEADQEPTDPGRPEIGWKTAELTTGRDT